MKCYPLGIAALLAIVCDCIRRGDLDGAGAALDRARALVAGGAEGGVRAGPAGSGEGRAA